MKRNETRIDILMAEHNIRSVKELAGKMNLSQQVLSSRLSGNISLDTIEKISSYFDVPLKEMFR